MGRGQVAGAAAVSDGIEVFWPSEKFRVLRVLSFPLSLALSLMERGQITGTVAVSDGLLQYDKQAV